MNIIKIICFIFASLFSLIAQATIHVSLESVQQQIFPNEKLELATVSLPEPVREKMQEASTVRQHFKTDHIYKSNKGEWLIIDEVVGKHEMIKYAVGINADGSVRQIAIMDYVESYGYEVDDLKWRAQFVGKTAASTIKLNKDIDNISGATLSCKHLADGVKRVMVMYDLALKNLK
jgi:Na+-translocating ferredoxin:NAD+ oxidoreductase RnfG subunit